MSITNSLIEQHKAGVAEVKHLIMKYPAERIPNGFHIKDLSYRTHVPAYLMVSAILELEAEGKVRVLWPYIHRIDP